MMLVLALLAIAGVAATLLLKDSPPRMPTR